MATLSPKSDRTGRLDISPLRQVSLTCVRIQNRHAPRRQRVLPLADSGCHAVAPAISAWAKNAYTGWLIGHVAVRVQWPGVVVCASHRVVCGGERGESRTGRPADRYSHGGVVRHPRWRPRADESQSVLLPEYRRPGQECDSRGPRSSVLSARRHRRPIALADSASTVVAKARRGESSRVSRLRATMPRTRTTNAPRERCLVRDAIEETHRRARE